MYSLFFFNHIFNFKNKEWSRKESFKYEVCIEINVPVPGLIGVLDTSAEDSKTKEQTQWSLYTPSFLTWGYIIIKKHDN